MNINRKSYPIMEQIQKGKLNLSLTEEHRFYFLSCFPFVENIIRSKPTVDYICKNQVEEVNKVELNFSFDQIYSTYGILLFANSENKGTLIYKINKHDRDSANMNLFYISRNTPVVNCNVLLNPDLIDIETTTIHIQKSEATALVVFALNFLHFKKYAQIKDKIISRKTKGKCRSASGIVSTDFKYPINVIDEAYYTNYIMSEGFSVRAHDRHYKSGKLIKINSFQKNGYSRQARILNNAA